jgi:hypothetical protein
MFKNNTILYCLLGTSNAHAQQLDRIAGAYEHHWPDKRCVLRLLNRRSKIGGSDGNASCCGVKCNSYILVIVGRDKAIGLVLLR